MRGDWRGAAAAVCAAAASCRTLFCGTSLEQCFVVFGRDSPLTGAVCCLPALYPSFPRGPDLGSLGLAVCS